MPSNLSIDASVVDAVLTMCDDVGSPRALTVAILLRNREYAQLVDLKVEPRHYNDSESLQGDYAVTSFLRKCAGLPTGIDTEAQALEKFWLAERQCYKSNERLSPLLYDSLHYGEGMQRVIDCIRKKIRLILGDRPPEGPLRGRFGPGATFADLGRLSTVPDKMTSSPTITSSALYFYLFDFTGTAWYSALKERNIEPAFVRGNRFTTVAKDATTDRGICIEPSVNVFYQLALGRAMRDKLRRVGIDLQHGQSIHRQVACEASLSGSMATIDLSNASDTVCSNLVKLLLPEEWTDCLSMLRSSHSRVKDKWVRLEKFSSMGNGFTFELETLIFLAISWAICEIRGSESFPGHGIHVYGDDIIVPTEHAGEVLAALRFLGFTPNERKTFTEGWFRESCGGDFYKGRDVRPFFLSELPSEPHHFIAMANGVRRMARSEPDRLDRHHTYLRTWFRILDAIPSHLRRLRGPEDLGDIVIHDDRERWQTRTRHCIRYIRCYRPARFTRVGWEHWHPDVVLASALYGVGDGQQGRSRSSQNDHHRINSGLPANVNVLDSGGVIPRNSVISYKVGWVPRS